MRHLISPLDLSVEEIDQLIVNVVHLDAIVFEIHFPCSSSHGSAAQLFTIHVTPHPPEISPVGADYISARNQVRSPPGPAGSTHRRGRCPHRPASPGSKAVLLTVPTSVLP